MNRLRVPAATLIAATIFMLSSGSSGQGSTAAVDKILPTLALVVANKTNGESATGTGFCFWSTASKSYFLTNHHVVDGASQVLLKLEFLDNHKLLPARVYRRNDSLAAVGIPNDSDLDILVVDVGGVPHVTLQEYPFTPKAGQAIGVAGFPSFRFELRSSLTEVSPSVHFGSVNSVPNEGEITMNSATYFEHDALIDHGNSGGPLFDRGTGIVLGVVTLGIDSKTSKTVRNNLAISGQTAGMFIFGTYLPHSKYSESYGIKEDIPCLGGTSQYVQAKSGGWCLLPDAVTTR